MLLDTKISESIDLLVILSHMRIESNNVHDDKDDVLTGSSHFVILQRK